MYGEIGSIHEDYNRVAATVTAVSIWINRNKKDKVISAIGTHMIKLDFLIYDCVKLPVGIRSCTLISRCSDQRGTTS
jgi:hypothetical protein